MAIHQATLYRYDRFQSAEHTAESLENTHRWEMSLATHIGYQPNWAQASHSWDPHSWGLYNYHVDTGGNDITLMWGQAYSTSLIILGNGRDKVFGNVGNDKIHGGGGDDLLRGGIGNDEIMGGTGDDIIYGDEGGDVLHGGDGDDIIYAGRGNHSFQDYGSMGFYINNRMQVYGADGTSYINYSNTNDVLMGGAGNDILIDYGSGSNIFAGGAGNDIIHLGSGKNTVVVDPHVSKNHGSYDFVTGFTQNDVVIIRAIVESGIAPDFDAIKTTFGISVREEADGTGIYVAHENGSDEKIVFLHGFIGFGLKNFGFDIPEPKPISVTFSTTSFSRVEEKEPEGEAGAQTTKTVSTQTPETLTTDGDITQSSGAAVSKPVKPETTVSSVTETVTLPEEPVIIEGTESFTFTPATGAKTSESVSAELTLGTEENDTIKGTIENDFIDALSGDDWVRGHDGDDILRGNDGADKLYGDTGNDFLYGGEGDDFLTGGFGNDALFGGDGFDTAFFRLWQIVSIYKQ